MGNKDLATIQGSDLAIGIQLAAAVGNSRQLTLTTAVPLDWTATQINETLDKLMASVDRQNNKANLSNLKRELEQAEKDAATQATHLGDYEKNAQAEWLDSNRRGAFKLNERQQAQVNNFKSTVEKYKTLISKLRHDIKELEQAA